MEIGDKITLNGIKYEIVGKDESPPHPSGAHKKWDYILRDVESRRIKYVLADFLKSHIQLVP